MTVAAAEAPKSQAELSFALFEETRALRVSMEQLVAQNAVRITSEYTQNLTLTVQNVEMSVDDLRAVLERVEALVKGVVDAGAGAGEGEVGIGIAVDRRDRIAFLMPPFWPTFDLTYFLSNPHFVIRDLYILELRTE